MLPPDTPTPAIAVVVDRYPSLIEPFVAEELRGLEQLGLNFEIWSLQRPRVGKLHPAQAEVAARVRYLPDSFSADPVRMFGGMVRGLGAPGGAFGAWLRSVMRATSPGVFSQFGAAATIHAEANPATTLFYAMGIGQAAAVARLAAIMRGVEWGCRASEPTVWTLTDAEKTERLESAAFCLASSETVGHHLRPFAPGGDRVVVAHSAIDLSRFTPPPEDVAPRLGDSRELPVRLVSIGQLKESRGYVDLLNALADMPKGTHWRLVHIGEGKDGPSIRQHALNVGLGPKVIWRGACDQTEVLAALRDADIYVQAPRSPGSEREGLPHAVLEAASQRLAIITTRSTAAAEFLVADENALVVRNGQTAILTDAIQRLARDPAERARLGGSARLKVESTRALSAVLDIVARRLRLAMA